MARFIHLNGPPGIGKSTISALYAERHPGTLNLDIDALHPFVGGWREPGFATHQLLRPVARAMAAAHLQGGHDVVLPQYLARIEEIHAFEDVARSCGAEFLEVILLSSRDESRARFERRPVQTAWDEHNERVVDSLGGAAFLAQMYDRLLDVAKLRPAAVVIESDAGAIEETYAALMSELSVFTTGLDH